MSRDHERLDRLMGLLRSEGRQGSDLRRGVMARLARSDAVRSGAAWAWRLAAGLALLATLAILVELRVAGGRSADLGETMREGVRWLAPPASAPREPLETSPQQPDDAVLMARAPWRGT